MVRATGSDRRVVARNRTGVKSPVPRAPCSGIRLLRINAKRSIGKWLWPLCVGLAWFAAREQRPIGATLWPETSDGIGRTAMLIGPLAGGAAAWVAAQDRRHRVDGLARVLPSRAQCIHHLSRVMGLLLWCWLAYLAFGLYLGTIALREATWGTINLVPVWLGLITIAATTALGYWAGLLVPYMATAPVCALLYFAWLLGMPSFVSASPVQYLSPFPFLGFGQGVLVRHWSAVAWPLTGWLGGLIGVATVAAALRYYRKLYLVASLVAMLAIAFGSAVTLLSLPSRPAWIARDWLPYEPICVRQEVEVCVHPAFRALLSQTAATANDVFRPVAGLPGVPVRIEQYARWRYASLPEGVADLPIYLQSNGADLLAAQYASFLIQDDESRRGSGGLSPAQCAVGRWLVRQAGHDLTNRGWFMPGPAFVPTDLMSGGSGDARQKLDTDIEEARGRFGRLSTDEQRVWLSQHWEPLRAGALGLDALP